MQTIQLKSHIGDDGLLKVHLPEASNTEVEVIIVYQSVATFNHPQLSLGDFYGICADDPITIDDKGIDETRDDELGEAFR